MRDGEGLWPQLTRPEAVAYWSWDENLSMLLGLIASHQQRLRERQVQSVCPVNEKEAHEKRTCLASSSWVGQWVLMPTNERTCADQRTSTILVCGPGDTEVQREMTKGTGVCS